MNTKPSSKPIGRKALREALETVPTESLFSPAVSRELTGKQKRFAREIALGATGAGAYRKAYDSKGKPKTVGDHASRLKGDARIQAEIEAIKRAIAAQEYQTPTALRALVIQSLVGVITDPDSQPGQITAAAKVLGTVTEVAAFTERKEVRTITSSEDARAKIMAELKQLANADAVDVQAIDADADSLLAELADSGESETHLPGTPQIVDEKIHPKEHTIPHERFPPELDSKNSTDSDPPPSQQDDPPSSFEK